MEKDPMKGGVNNSPQDQLYQNGQDGEWQARLSYQASGYRIAAGPVILRAVERLVEERSARIAGAETTPWESFTEDDNAQTVASEPTPAEPYEAKEKERPALANVYADPKRHTVSFLLDETTANTVIYAVRLLAADSEAHAREVRMVRATLPPDSYGAANRNVIAERQERIAARLRVLEGNYRAVVE